MVGARSRDCVTRRRPSTVNVLGCIDEASLLNEDSNATCHFQINTLFGMLSLERIISVKNILHLDGHGTRTRHQERKHVNFLVRVC